MGFHSFNSKALKPSAQTGGYDITGHKERVEKLLLGSNYNYINPKRLKPTDMEHWEQKLYHYVVCCSRRFVSASSQDSKSQSLAFCLIT